MQSMCLKQLFETKILKVTLRWACEYSSRVSTSYVHPWVLMLGSSKSLGTYVNARKALITKTIILIQSLFGFLRRYLALGSLMLCCRRMDLHASMIRSIWVFFLHKSCDIVRIRLYLDII